VFLGVTGSGKSVLARELLTRYQSYFVFDMQESMKLSGVVVRDPANAAKLINKGTPRIIYRPRRIYQEREISNYILDKLLDSSSSENPHPRIIYIDEIFQLGYMQSFPDNLPKGMTFSRQRQLSFWISTQRPKLIPTNILAQASHFFVFYQNNEGDKERIAEFAPRSDEFLAAEDSLQYQDYRFIYINHTNMTFQLYNKLRVRA